MRIHSLLFGFCVFASIGRAGELTIEPQPFTVEKTFNASVMPGDAVIDVRIEPEAWTEFRIEEIAAHGKRVAKGDVLLRFDAEAIDSELADVRRETAAGKLALDQATQELAHLQETATHRMEALQRAARIASEENDYFQKTRRKAAIETADQQLERKKQELANQQEELKQLKKMYEADDLTENTEEIILTRQKDALAAAEFSLRMEQLDHKRAIEVVLPREAVTLANNQRDTAIHLRKATTEIPRGIEIKKAELETLKANYDRTLKLLAKLERDRTLFEVKAKADGWFYHGSIENGRWARGDAKSLVKHGQPTLNQAIAAVIPANATRVLTAFVDEQTAAALPSDFNGIAIPPGREDLEIPVSLAKLSSISGSEEQMRVDLSAKWPDKFQAIVGATMSVRVICHHRDAAVVVPRKALERDLRGWTVAVKLADGKSQRRVVRCGRPNADEIEIVSGLDAGQVIIVP